MIPLLSRLLLRMLIGSLGACGASSHLSQDTSNKETIREIKEVDPNCPLEYPSSAGRTLCAKIFWLEGPSSPDENSYTLKFWYRDTGSADWGPYMDPEYDVFVLPWMVMKNGREHGTAPTSVSRQEPGIYKVDRVFFIMPGRWQMRIQLKDGPTLVQTAVQIIDVL